MDEDDFVLYLTSGEQILTSFGVFLIMSIVVIICYEKFPQENKEDWKKPVNYLINAYAETMKMNFVFALSISIGLSIVFILTVNAIWNIAYSDLGLLDIDSELTVGTAIEVFISTVMTLLLAVLTWRVESRLRKKDEKEHKKELKSKLKRELASNELKATVSFREINDVFHGQIILKSKNNSTIFPPFFSIENGSVKCEFEGCDVQKHEIKYNVDSICIDFEQSCSSADVERLFSPICYCMLEEEPIISLKLNFIAFDISTDIEYNKSHKNKSNNEQPINSSHILKVCSPLKQFANQAYGFECDVISNLI